MDMEPPDINMSLSVPSYLKPTKCHMARSDTVSKEREAASSLSKNSRFNWLASASPETNALTLVKLRDSASVNKKEAASEEELKSHPSEITPPAKGPSSWAVDTADRFQGATSLWGRNAKQFTAEYERGHEEYAAKGAGIGFEKGVADRFEAPESYLKNSKGSGADMLGSAHQDFSGKGLFKMGKARDRFETSDSYLVQARGDGVADVGLGHSELQTHGGPKLEKGVADRFASPGSYLVQAQGAGAPDLGEGHADFVSHNSVSMKTDNVPRFESFDSFYVKEKPSGADAVSPRTSFRLFAES